MRTLIATVLALGLATSAVFPAGAEGNSRDFAGIWWTKIYMPRLLPTDGQALPFTAEGRSRYDQTVAGLKSGTLIDQAVRLCVPEGMPRAMTSPYPFQIMMTPGQVTFAHEANRAYRIVSFTDKHANAETWDPSYMGDGIASWDGDTLVIDSTNFKSDKIFLDSTGVPASERLDLVERLKLIDGGRELEDLITVNDPVMFTRPWTARRVFERREDVKLRMDWICGEPHRDVSAIVGAAVK